MANSITSTELAAIVAEEEACASDAMTYDALRWRLLEAAAHLATVRLILGRPAPPPDSQRLQPLVADLFGGRPPAIRR